MASCEPQEIRNNAIQLLDNARRDHFAAHYDRIRSIRVARACGMSYREIGEVLGMTESGVRKLFLRAGDV
jgi:DNA-binding NarL/FixJ family response regulator